MSFCGSCFEHHWRELSIKRWRLHRTKVNAIEADMKSISES